MVALDGGADPYMAHLPRNICWRMYGISIFLIPLLRIGISVVCPGPFLLVSELYVCGGVLRGRACRRYPGLLRRGTCVCIGRRIAGGAPRRATHGRHPALLPGARAASDRRSIGGTTSGRRRCYRLRVASLVSARRRRWFAQAALRAST